jgi:hypothetical protein
MAVVLSPSARSVATPIGPVTQEYSIVSVDAVTAPVPSTGSRPAGATRVPMVALPVATEETVAEVAVMAADPKLARARAGEEIAVEMVNVEAVSVEAARLETRTRVAARGAAVKTTGVVGPV